MKKGVYVSVCVVMAAVFFLLNGVAASAGPSGKLVVAQPSEPLTIDPHKVATRYSHTFNCALFEALYVRDSLCNLVPGVAEDVEISENGLTYTFMLRHGIRFHDGSTLTAEDVKFSLDRACNPETKNPMGAYLKSVDGVKIMGSDKVVISLKTPDAIFLKKMAYAGWIIPKNYFEKVGEKGFAEHPIGSGPYKFVSRSINEYIELEANEDHWRWVPKIKTVIHRVVPEDAVRLAMLQTGDADVAIMMPPALFDKINSIRGYKALSHPSGAIYWVNIDNKYKDSPLKNRKVRQALNYAVNKKGIIDGIMKGHAVQISGVMAPSVIPPDPTLEAYDYNPKLAKKLLADAGYPNGFKTDFYGPIGRYTLGKEISTFIADNIKAVGIDVELHLWESMKWVTEMQKHYYPLTYSEFGNTIFDPEGKGVWALHTDAFWGFYTNLEVDKLIEESKSIYDEKERIKHWQKIDRALYEDASHIFLYEFNTIIGINEKLNWKLKPGDTWYKYWDAYWK
jgi:peptide/nickel transport system substrate-binding protein